MNQALFYPGVAWLDLDEIKNRVVFGIGPGIDPERIRGLARSQGVPEEAVDFEVDGPYMRQASLRDSIRPIAGATQVAYLDIVKDSVFDCTLGFPAVWNGQRAYVSASHCSTNQFTVDSTRQYQPKWPVTHADSMNISPIGIKVADSTDPCPPKVHASVCSTTDVAVWKFTLDSSQWVLGRIARPTFGCSPGPCSPPNLQIGSYFTVTATQDNIPVDALVSMIGRTSGWSQAYVQKGCINVPINADSVLVCQVAANYGDGDGDSGAPILMNIGLPSDSTVTVAGVHSGDTPRYSIFTPWSAIAAKYNLSVH